VVEPSGLTKASEVEPYSSVESTCCRQLMAYGLTVVRLVSSGRAVVRLLSDVLSKALV